MDWGVENGTATIVALSDGTASVYLSSGGGSIGGQSNQAINSAAKRAVSLASESQSKMRLTHSFPLPRRGEVIFYVLTDGGVFTAAATEEELQDGKHPLSRLGNAMQGVITQYRLLQGGR